MSVLKTRLNIESRNMMAKMQIKLKRCISESCRIGKQNVRVGLDSEKRLILRKDAKRCEMMGKEAVVSIKVVYIIQT